MKRTACAWVAMAGLLLAGCGSSSNGRAPGGSGGQIGNAGSGGSAGQGGAGAAGSAGQGGSGGQTAACTGGQTACGTACVDLQTDAANCGACGHDCLGGSCKAGLCSPMPVGPDGVEALVVDGGSVYFMSATNGQTLNRFSLNDNSLAQLASGFSNLEDLRVRGGNVYWAGYNETTQHDEFFSVPTTGGTVKSVQQNADMYGVDFLGDSAYSVSDCSNIYRVSLLDGSDTVINQDGCNVFGGVYSVQIDQAGAYGYTSFAALGGNTELWKVALGSGQHTVLDSDLDPNRSLLLDSGSLYFYDGISDRIGRIGVDGSGRKVIADATQLLSGAKPDKLGPLVAYKNKLYWSAGVHQNRYIFETATDGSGSRMLMRQPVPYSYGTLDVGVDDQFVYFSNDGPLSKVAK